MFVQVIEGKVRDEAAMHERLKIWERDLRPGAVGYLGSTGGCTSTGDCILIARFESREAAMRNSERPEQAAWWEETERCFDGPVTFHDTEDVHLMMHGNPDEAQFVQAMDGHTTDRDRAIAFEREFDAMLAEVRPELLGSITAFYDGDAFTEIAYFTSEDDARRGERREATGEAAAMLTEWHRLMKIDRYSDIEEPWLTTA